MLLLLSAPFCSPMGYPIVHSFTLLTPEESDDCHYTLVLSLFYALFGGN